MLRALAALFVKKSAAWATIVVVVAATVVLAFSAAHVQRDDNLLAFLPRGNKDIQVFKDVNREFGGLNVALVGVATDDALAPDFLAQLRTATKRLNETKDAGVAYAMSLANFEDFAPDPDKGGISVDYLIPAKLPSTPEGIKALREKVLSRDQVVGNVLSADGKAALIYCFLKDGTDPKESANHVRKLVEESLPGHAIYWGGAPFIQSYIFGVTARDLGRLTPWACVVIVLISLWAFRDVVGMLLALFTTAVGIVAALGLMGIFGVPTNLVLGSMPVILFALGSAYPIHILVRYYAVVKEMGRDKAIEHIITYLGPTVIASGLTACGGLLSFVAMDMQPIRTFGLFTGIGVLVTLMLSVTFVPAVIRVADLKPRLSLDNHTSKGMIRFTTAIQKRRLPVGVALVVLSLAGAAFVGRLDSRIDNSSFYSAKSPPAQAEAFLRERFGGSQFFQVYVTADMTDPDVLREVRGIADHVAVLPHVSSVNHVGAVISKVNEAMEGDERIPDTAAKVKTLYAFLKGKRAVSQLVTEDHAHALMMAKVDSDRAGDLDDVLAEVEKVVADVPAKYALADAKTPEGQKHLKALVEARIHALAQEYEVAFGKEQGDVVAHVVEQHAAGSSPTQVDKKPIEAAILAYLHSEEFSGDIPKSPADAPGRVAAALAGLGARPTKDAIAKATASALDRPESDGAVLDLAHALRTPVAEILRRQLGLAAARRLVAEAKLAVPAGARGQRFVAGLGAALMDLDVGRVALPAPAGDAKAASFATTVTGTPVLNRGLSRSVDTNQLKSFFMAMGLVLLICLYLYRSFTSALLAMAPVSLTLLVVYGGMGLLGVHLDIGTSMLASLTTGAGVDYALHLLAAWKGPPAKGDGAATDAELGKAATYASFLVGRAIWTNALMVAGGFVVLTMGEARPLQNVGGLTAAAMMAAALATFVTVPLLARKRAYDARPRINEILSSSPDFAEPALGADPDATPSPSPARGSS